MDCKKNYLKSLKRAEKYDKKYVFEEKQSRNLNQIWGHQTKGWEHRVRTLWVCTLEWARWELFRIWSPSSISDYQIDGEECVLSEWPIKNYVYDLWPCDFRVSVCGYGYAFVHLDSSVQIDIGSNWPCVFSRATHFPKVCFRFSCACAGRFSFLG